SDPPPAPAFFALLVRPIVEALDLEFNVWYLDDATLGDTPERALEALRLVMDNAAEVGLHLNSAKSELAVTGAGSEEERAAILEAFRAVAPDIVDLPSSAT